MGGVSQKYTAFRSRIVLFIKGIGMGAADVIPGVSGGTIAFMAGIYEDLIDSVRSFNVPALRLLLAGRFRDLLAAVEWPFLLVLLSGIGTSIVLLSSAVEWLLHNEPVLLNAFFFGLITASVPVIMGHLRLRQAVHYTAFLVAAGGMYWLVGLVPVQTPETPLFIFGSGVIAICAMILPGISGSFILLLLGKYAFIISAIVERNLQVLALFFAGCVVGILSFVRFVHLLFARWHDVTVAVLAGLVLGSLRKIWPWKNVLETMITPKGEVVPLAEMNVLPKEFDARFYAALILMAAGFALAMALDRQARPK